MFCRLLVEGDSEPVVYHNVNNSRVFQGKEPQKLTVSAEVQLKFLNLSFSFFFFLYKLTFF